MRHTRRDRSPSALRRWLRFNFVGLIGVGVQLAALDLVLSTTRLDYRWATMLAVEAAVLHNFCWHLRYTWRERRLDAVRVIVRRLLEFHLTNGAVSLAGSWTLMSLLVGRERLPVIAANLITIGTCSIVNFLLAEVVVFRRWQRKKTSRRRAKVSHQRRIASVSCIPGPKTGKFQHSEVLRVGGGYEEVGSNRGFDGGSGRFGYRGIHTGTASTALCGSGAAVADQQSSGV